MPENVEKKLPNRRTVVKGAAWAAPVIALAVATPAAAASTTDGGPQPNDVANYYWESSADASFATLSAAQSGNRAQFSAQVAYQSDPWVGPPTAGILSITVTFNKAVEASNLGAPWQLVSSSGDKTTFTFTQPSEYGGAGLTFDAASALGGTLTASAAMSILNPERSDGSTASWAQEPATASAELVA